VHASSAASTFCDDNASVAARATTAAEAAVAVAAMKHSDPCVLYNRFLHCALRFWQLASHKKVSHWRPAHAS